MKECHVLNTMAANFFGIGQSV